MATQDGRRVNRPYRKASEYLASSKQATYNGPRTIAALENENAELREKLTVTVRRMENMEVEFDQSRDYFSTQLDITTDKLNRTTQTLKLLQRSYSELQSINYELEQRILKVGQLEADKSQLTSDIHELTNKLTDARASLGKAQKENERLRKDCNLAVQLLQCNEGNFRQQRTRELPQDLQHRVEEYRMDISQYNEYINPNAIDSDEENGPQPGHRRQNNDSVPTELLAKVLQKPENVHLNLESTDYIRDAELNSAYKGQIAEKKLVKYNYDAPDTEQKSATVPRSSSKAQTAMTRSSSGVQSSSPWEMGPTAPSSGTESSGSPWELSTDGQRDLDDTDDYGSASAYGAYPVSYRRPRPPPGPTRYNFASDGGGSSQNDPNSVKKSSSYSKSKMSVTYSKVTSPKVQKGTGENEDVYISQTYHQREAQTQESSSSSNKSSTKSTPAKVPVDRERGTSAEKSSLLDQEGSEEEDMVMTVELGGRGPSLLGIGSPVHRYGGHKMGDEGRGLLNNDSEPEPDERELNEEEEGNVREYEEEGNMREYEEESHVREYGEEVNDQELVKHDLPDINLLNLDDDATVNVSPQNSPAHHIMIQQFLQDLESPITDVTGTTLLPDLPPPSGFSEQMYGEELIVGGELLVPPPPDMYVENGETSLTPPQNVNQSEQESQVTGNMTSLSEAIDTVTVTSQMHNTTSLDDIQVFAGLEINNTHKKFEQSPHIPPEQTQENTKVTSSDQTRKEENDDLISDQGNVENDEVGEEAGSFDDITSEVTSQETPTTQEDDENETTGEQTQAVKENGSDPVMEKNGAIDGDCDDTQDQDVMETVQTEDGNTENSSNLYGSTELEDESQEIEQNNSCEIETLEVLDLQEEPRGGTYNRRRRNSFDQAREYGSVMDD